MSRSIIQKRAPSLPHTDNVSISYYDGYRRKLTPHDNDLVREYKRTVYTCANLNADAATCTPRKLYIKTEQGQKKSQVFKTGVHSFPVSKETKSRLVKTFGLRQSTQVEEVVSHPALEQLKKVNDSPLINFYDLEHWTNVYLDITGNSYWLIENNVLGRPRNIWVLPSQYVTPKKKFNSKSNRKPIDFYEYTPPGSDDVIKYKPEDIVHFKTTSITNPYSDGLSALESSFDSVNVNNQFVSVEAGLLENEGRPDFMLAPKSDDVAFGDAQRRRYEREYKTRFGRGRSGGMWVIDEALTMMPLNVPPRDLARLEIEKWTANDIANSFQVPYALISGASHNREQLEAAEVMHAKHGVRPRTRRYDIVLNDQFLTRYDQSGRLFFASDDPVPEDKTIKMQEVVQFVMNGILTPNEGRKEYDLPPLPGGDELRPINVSPEMMRDNERSSGSAEK